MSQSENDLHQRMSIPELNQLLNNAGVAYRQNEISNEILLELKQRFQISGIEGFRDLPHIKSHPRKTPAWMGDKILSLSIEHPGWGCVRLSNELKTQGLAISSPTIQKLLIQNGMGNKNERLWKLEEKSLAGEIQPSQEQILKIEKFNPCFRERNHPSNCPGQLLAQDTIMVGSLSGIGKVYLQSAIDTYNSFAFGFIHPSRLPDCAVALLHNEVLPFYNDHHLRIETINTHRGRQYCGTGKHHYELYLLLNEIQHQTSIIHNTRNNGFIERFHQIVFTEFFQKVLQTKTYSSLEKLQNDFAEWLHFYNYKRPHYGYRNMGIIPFALHQKYLDTRTH
jgi:hypothetical protein